MEYRVSIIVPVYKCEKSLAKCIDSLISQELQEVQIILVDDGSPDNCGKICDEYAKKDSRILVKHQTNQGAGAARNKGLLEAMGEYIAFVDSDDWVDPDMFLRMYELAVKNNIDIVRCNTLIHQGTKVNMCWIPECVNVIIPDIDIKKSILPLLIAPEIEGKYNQRLLKGCVCCIFRREFIQSNNVIFKDIKNGQDAIFTTEAMWKAQNMILMKESFYHYIKQEAGSLSISMNKFRNYKQRKESRDIIYNLVKGSEYENIYLKRWQQEDRRYIYLDVRIATVFNPLASPKEKLDLLREVVYSAECKNAFSVAISDKLPMQLNLLYFLISHKLYRLLYVAMRIKFGR